MALQPVNSVERGLIIFACVVVDTIGLIPVLGNFADFAGFISLNFYFLIKLGARYFSGKRSGQKMANTVISGMVSIMPVVGNFVPELAIQAATMFWILDKEEKEEREKMVGAANDNAAETKRRLSRAA